TGSYRLSSPGDAMWQSRLPKAPPTLVWILASLCVCLLGGAARGVDEPSPEALRQAEKKYRAAALEEAERLFKIAVETRDSRQRRYCYDRLLAIYVRLGRFDLALKIGERYRAWLRESNDRVRIRELDLQLGEWYLALGQYREADPCLERSLSEEG